MPRPSSPRQARSKALASLERLRLAGTGVEDLTPLSGHPAPRALVLDTPDRAKAWPPLELPALRALQVDLSHDEPPTLGFLCGCPSLEEVRLSGGGVADPPVSVTNGDLDREPGRRIGSKR